MLFSLFGTWSKFLSVGDDALRAGEQAHLNPFPSSRQKRLNVVRWPHSGQKEEQNFIPRHLN